MCVAAWAEVGVGWRMPRSSVATLKKRYECAGTPVKTAAVFFVACRNRVNGPPLSETWMS